MSSTAAAKPESVVNCRRQFKLTSGPKKWNLHSRSCKLCKRRRRRRAKSWKSWPAHYLVVVVVGSQQQIGNIISSRFFYSFALETESLFLFTSSSNNSNNRLEIGRRMGKHRAAKSNLGLVGLHFFLAANCQSAGPRPGLT